MDHSIKNRLLICFHFLLRGIWQCSFVYEAGVCDWAFVCVMPHFTHDLCIYRTFSNWDLHWGREKGRIKGTSQWGHYKHLEKKSSVGVRHASNTNNTKGPLTGDTWALLRNFTAYFPMSCICKVAGTLRESCPRPCYDTVEAEINAFHRHGLQGATACLIKDCGRCSQ